MKLLVDVCTFSQFTQISSVPGVEVHRVTEYMPGDATDPNITAYAVMNGFTVVTSNREDFLKTYSGFQEHPGLILLLQSLQYVNISTLLQQQGSKISNNIFMQNERGRWVNITPTRKHKVAPFAALAQARYAQLLIEKNPLR